MRRRHWWAIGLIWTGSTLGVAAGRAEPDAPLPAMLDLATAESIAVAHQPTILAALLRTREAGQQIREARAGYMPVVAFNATGVRTADVGTAIAAGNITTSAISDRFAYGGALNQLVTDFGRTSALVSTQKFLAEAQKDLATLSRAQVRLGLRSAFYGVLGAEAVQRAAEAARDDRQLLARQATSLAQSQIRSTLDVDFANVLTSEAELAVVHARAAVARERAALATAMGLRQPVSVPLSDVGLPASVPPEDPEGLIANAQAQRADLAATTARQRSAAEFARSEKRLSNPSVNLLAAAGQLPYHDSTLHNNYAAVGVNLNIPIFNGGLFAARQQRAKIEADAQAREVDAAELKVGEEVRDAWYRSRETYQSMAVTDRLVAQCRRALRLAQDRYESGLGSILEVNQAQLQQTSAEIQEADAKYAYLAACAELDFASGMMN